MIGASIPAGSLEEAIYHNEEGAPHNKAKSCGRHLGEAHQCCQDLDGPVHDGK